MKIKIFSACALLVLLFAGSALPIFACACCAESGTYAISTARPNLYELGILKEIQFGDFADLYMTEAGFDMIRGLTPLEKEYNAPEAAPDNWQLALKSGFTGKGWRFSITSKGGKTGTLVLPMPLRMVSFKADIHDNTDKGLGPILYKEFRFKGTVASGAGTFASGLDRTTSYFLVFQGRGNNCDNAEDFTHWRLEIAGKRSSYAFFGATAGNDRPAN
ncbi:MAG: hypothetical protein ACRD43_10750 [Pyrinomonadaceae bacterium]